MSRHEFEDVLRQAGIRLRDGRKLPPVTEWAHRYTGGGETGAEIAATFDVTPNAVLRALSAAGFERRPALVRMISLSDDDVRARYVHDRLSVQATAKRLGVSAPRVRAAVGRLGVLRRAFDPSTVDGDRSGQR